MKKRTIISGAIALILSIYTLVTWNMVRGLKIYTVSYETGRWLVSGYIPVGFAALAAWGVFAVFLLKDLPVIIGLVKKRVWLKPKSATEQKTMMTVEMTQGAANVSETVDATSTTNTFCEKCGAKIELDYRFCGKCGASLNQEG